MLSLNYHHNCFLIEGFFPKKSTVFEIEECFCFFFQKKITLLVKNVTL